MSEKLSKLKARYLELCHAMQTGVTFMMHFNGKEVEPKHLRVGINASMSDHGALVQLLLKKGLITEEEYYEELCESMQREVDNYLLMINRERENNGLPPANIVLR